MTTTQVYLIPADRIQAGDNDRTVFDGIDSLAASIEREGLIQPLTVRVLDSEVTLAGEVHRYEVVAGERRLRACRQLGWTEIPCLVRSLDDVSAARVMLHENVVRLDLDPIDEAEAYRKRLDDGATVDDLVSEGMKRSRIDLLLPLLDLCDEAQHLVRRRQLSPTLARRMAPLDVNRQVAAIREYADTDMTAAQFQALCTRLLEEQQAEPLFDPATFLKLAEWAKSKPPLGKLGQCRVMLKRCAAALDSSDPVLAAEVRTLLAEMF